MLDAKDVPLSEIRSPLVPGTSDGASPSGGGDTPEARALEEAAIADECVRTRGGPDCTAISLHVNASATSVVTYSQLMSRLHDINRALEEAIRQKQEAARVVAERRQERSARARETMCGAATTLKDAAGLRGSAQEAVDAAGAALGPILVTLREAKRATEEDLAVHDHEKPRAAVEMRLQSAHPMEAPDLPRLPGGAGELADADVIRAEKAKQAAMDTEAVSMEEERSAETRSHRLEHIAARKEAESGGQEPLVAGEEEEEEEQIPDRRAGAGGGVADEDEQETGSNVFPGSDAEE